MSPRRLIWLTLIALLVAACGGPPPAVADVKLVRAVSTSDTTVALTFSEAVSDEAKIAANYKITPELQVLGAALSADALGVTLTTAPQTAADYTVTAQNITGQKGAKLDPAANKAVFKGTDGPAKVKEILSTGPTGVQITFTKPVADNAGDASNYRITKAGGAVLPITAAALNSFKTQVILTTAPQEAVDYTLTLSNITDAGGKPLDVVGKGDFKGTFVDKVPPRLTTAGATSNTTIVVTFSEPMQGGMESTENPAHYTISSNRSGGVAPQSVVIVKGAVLSADKTSVTLTTFPQSGIEYLLVITESKDLAGNQIAVKDRAGNFNEAKFVGKPEVGSPQDTDGDGLSDAEEQLGWFVTVKQGLTQVVKREVTSDLTKPDTDQDGLTDKEEKQYLTDPRALDTDGDQITDYKELTYIYSDPVNSDSDGDTLNDGLEFDFFKSSPNDKDTDGDQLNDDQEINLANRNPRVANIPVPSIEVGNFNMTLDVKFTKTSTSGTSEFKTKNITSSLAQTDNQTFSQTDARTNEFMVRGLASFKWKVGLDFGAAGQFDVEAQTTNSWSSSFTAESSKETQKSYQDSLESGFQQSVEDSVTRSVEGASIKATVNLRNQSNVAFALSDLQVTVFFQDPEKPDKLLPIGTLKPSVDKYNFAVNEKKDNQIFESVAGSIFPATVEALMENPQGLIFKVSNYNITDENNRNFAFTSQAINDRTAPVVIDYDGFDSDGDGEGDSSERLRVATSAGRIIEDINGDNLLDDKDRILYDKSGKQVGITLREVLESVMGLKHYDEDANPSDGLSKEAKQNSYSTKKITDQGKTVEMLWRVRQMAPKNLNERRFWAVINATGIDLSQDFNSRVIKTEAGVTLAFVQDVDADLIPARLEYLKGCSDEKLDTDGDGVSDYQEEYQGWEVNITGKGRYQAFASCRVPDTDLDGLTDPQEKALGTDPAKKDSDLDGVSDPEEVNGYTVNYILGGTKNVTTSPTKPDTDGDGVMDGVERRMGGDPTVSDRDVIADDDIDGLTNLRENNGWFVNPIAVSTLPYEPGAQNQPTQEKSNPKAKDTDGDGLSDLDEYTKGTNPNLGDTDGDGVPDKTDPDPRDADMDNDMRSDGAEAQGCNGGNPTSPTNPDTDGDILVDGFECNTFGTDPTNPNTDGDLYTDGREFQLGTNPLFKDVYLTIDYVSIECIGSCDNATGSLQNLIAGDGEFIFSLGVGKPDGTVVYMWNVDAYVQGIYLRRGMTYRPTDLPTSTYNTSSVILRDGQTLNLVSTEVVEDDGFGPWLSNLGRLGEPMNYSKAIVDGSESKILSLGTDDFCKLKFTWKWTVRR